MLLGMQSLSKSAGKPDTMLGRIQREGGGGGTPRKSQVAKKSFCNTSTFDLH